MASMSIESQFCYNHQVLEQLLCRVSCCLDLDTSADSSVCACAKVTLEASVAFQHSCTNQEQYR